MGWSHWSHWSQCEPTSNHHPTNIHFPWGNKCQWIGLKWTKLDKLDHGKKSWTPESCFKSQHYAPSYTSDQECEYSDCICCILECCILLPFLVVIATRNHVKQANSIIASLHCQYLRPSTQLFRGVFRAVPGRQAHTLFLHLHVKALQVSDAVAGKKTQTNGEQGPIQSFCITFMTMYDNCNVGNLSESRCGGSFVMRPPS